MIISMQIIANKIFRIAEAKKQFQTCQALSLSAVNDLQ